MSDTTWTADEVQGFVARIGEFYGELTEAERQVFADVLSDRVQESVEVSGYSLTDQPLPTSAISEVISEYLLNHPSAAH